MASKPVKHNKNAETPLLLLSFNKSQHEKTIERRFFVSQKRVRNREFWE